MKKAMQAAFQSLGKRLGAACILFFALLPFQSLAVTPAGSTITNTAEVRFSVDGVQASVKTSHQVKTASTTTASVELLHFVGPQVSGAKPFLISNTQCLRNGQLGNSPSPRLLYAPTFSGIGTANVVSGPVFKGGDAIAIQVTDFDQNKDATMAETLFVDVSASGDTERVQLTETGLSTGVFTGYIQTTRRASSQNDCELSVQNNDQVVVKYVDPQDGAITAASIMIDPLGRVFDAVTGQLINGAKVTLMNVDTGLPAEVYNDDGVTRYPSVVYTGATVTDAGGNVASLAAGQYRFPLVVIGNYRLVVEAPEGYRFPSVISSDSGPALKDSSWRLGNGSRGETFPVVFGPPVEIDVPLDPKAGKIELTTSVSKDKASWGETLLYTIDIKNTDNLAANNLQVIDDIPYGMRLRAGSVRLAGGANPGGISLADPFVGNQGRQLRFDVAQTIAARSQLRLTYALQVTPSTPTGKQVNRAVARYDGGSSNTSLASVLVVDDLLATNAILLGRVWTACDEKSGGPVPGARIQLEDGRFAITDAQGAWHMEGVRPGGHVVQIDRHSLPKDATILDCRMDSASLSTEELRLAQMGKRGPNGELVHLRAGGIQRVDFAIRTTAALARQNPAPGVDALQKQAKANQGAENKANTAPPEPDSEFWKNHDAKPAFVFPPNDFSPLLPAVGVSFKHGKNQRVELLVNDETVSGFAYEGTKTQGDVVVSLWRAVSLKDGLNKMVAKIYGPGNRLLDEVEHSVTLPGSPVRAELLTNQSVLMADGNKPIRVVMRLRDSKGNPARRGLSGPFEIRGNYLAAQHVGDQLRDPSSGAAANAQQFTIGDKGLVEIVLQPSSQSGDLTIRFPSFELASDRDVKAWITPAPRDWIVVGLAEGSWMQSKLKEAVKPLSGAPGMDVDVDGQRVALYARGTIPGNFLLTVAYDSRARAYDPDRNLAQALKPDEHYLVYGDESSVQRDAVSSKKLYLRIEREQFYAMFGDFATRLTINEVARFDRVLNGVRTQAATKIGNAEISLNAFAAKTGQRAVRDELAFDGTTGAYRLSQRQLAPGTDRLRLQVRSPLPTNELLEERLLQRQVDYRIDYPTGDVVLSGFARPLSWGGNRVLIIAEYETMPGAQEDWVAGARMGAKLEGSRIGNVDTGLTVVHDGTSGKKGQLAGIDATVQFNPQNKLKLEAATSRGEVLNPTTGAIQETKGQAVSAEYMHKNASTDARVFYKQADNDYGIKSQVGTEAGTTRAGAQLRQQFDKVNSGLIDVQKNETPQSETTTLEARFEQRYGKAGWFTGVKAQETDTATNHSTNVQALGGVHWKSEDQRLQLRGEVAASVASSESNVSPNKYLIGGEYALNRSLSILAEQVWLSSKTDQAHLARAGFKWLPEWGGEWSVTAGQAATSVAGFNDADTRNLMALGYQQRFAVAKDLSLGLGIQRQHWIGSDALLQKTTAAPGANTAQVADKFTAAIASLQYSAGLWAAASTLEGRWGDALSREHFGTTVYRKQADGVALAAGFDWKHVTDLSTESREVLAKLAWAWRAPKSPWSVLHRIDLSHTRSQSLMAGSSTALINADKFISNLHAHYKLDGFGQIGLHHGAKYLTETVQGTNYQGWTNFLMLEARKELVEYVDLGVHAFGAHSHAARLLSYGYGADVGLSVGNYGRLSVGYNWRGLADGQFSEATWARAGSYVRLQMRFDEDSFKKGLDTSLGSASPR